MATPNAPAVQKQDERSVEFIPFGARDAIKLSASQVRMFIANPTKSGALPDDRQCIRFVMLCKAKRLNPYEGDAFLIGYDGHSGPEFSLITAHQAFLKRAEANPEYDGMNSGVIVESVEDPDFEIPAAMVLRRMGGRITFQREGDFVFDDETLVGGWAQVNFKARTTPTLRRAMLKTFDKTFGLWKNKENKPGMIVKCAEADALRSSFPTLLGGMYVEGEMQPLEVEGTVVSQSRAPITMPKALAEPAVTLAGDFTQHTQQQQPEPVTRAKAGKKPKAAAADIDADLEQLDAAELAEYRENFNRLMGEGLDSADAHNEALVIVRAAVEA